ncbi:MULTISPECIES: site-specific integrase [Methylosinus]|uniref:Integrase n=1 Tax=Methylosinus trichosporium (strain ATCC 35070 / NCIMB 11131 / UNIQEM 75 / OB3b) TaxID=595536 RepID=A0A2D2D181_METT3|nr:MULTISPECIES: site-specific integrase [Methylosinus]ATQ68730.1 integrase [Methylosinus trichosporium OB3b]OBS53111.1 integrase [Methylosinus sp. 3S-1]
MPIKLTKRAVDGLAARERAFIEFDADIAGFGVRVMPSGVKSFVVEYRPHGGGRSVAKRRVTLGKTTQLTPEQARRAAADMLAQVRLGADPAAEKASHREALTVAGLIEAFEAEHVAGKLKDSTGRSYRAGLDALKGAHGSLKAEALTRGQVAALHAKMRATRYAANRALATWSKMFAWGMKRGLVPKGDNPAREIDRYKEDKRERFLTSEELARLGDALREGETSGLVYEVDESKPKAKHAPKLENRRVKLDPLAAGAIRLLILTGARLREILDAQWSQVDSERGILFLSDSKTGRKSIYLSAAAQAVLANLPKIEGNPHVIAGAKDGEPRADLKKPWSAVKRAAGLEGVRLHDLRHSFASVGAGASLGLPIIGKLLGHTQAATTARYAHLDADPLRRAVDTIGATIAAAMDGGKPGGEVVPFTKKRDVT